MYQHEFIMFSLRPQEVPSFSTLFRPFGPILWLSIAGAVGILSIALVITSRTIKGKLYNLSFKFFPWITFYLRYYHSNFNVDSPECAPPVGEIHAETKCQKHPYLHEPLLWTSVRILLQRDPDLSIGGQGLGETNWHSTRLTWLWSHPALSCQHWILKGTCRRHKRGSTAGDETSSNRVPLFWCTSTLGSGAVSMWKDIKMGRGLTSCLWHIRVLNKTGVISLPRTGVKAIVKPEFYNSKQIIMKQLNSMVLPKASPIRVSTVPAT